MTTITVEQKRRPRFTRSITPPTIKTTQRDIAILDALDKNGAMSVVQIAMLVAPDARGCQPCQGSGLQLEPMRRCTVCNGFGKQGYRNIGTRLTTLFHAGLVARPRAQVSPLEAGSRRFVYRLDRLGAIELTKRDGRDRHREWSRNDKYKKEFLDHAVAISDFRVHLANALRGYPEITLVNEPELIAEINQRRAALAQPLKPITQIKFNPRIIVDPKKPERQLAAVPDITFALEQAKRRFHFLIEIDRATMPVQRHGFSRFTHTSIMGKCHAYHAAMQQQLPRDLFGWRGATVLFVTDTAARADHIRRQIRDDTGLERKKHFWVTDLAAMSRTILTGNFLDHLWLDAAGDGHSLAAQIFAA